ncbi:MAG: DNA polymerase III subunit beta [Christensenellales bacterium]
MRFICEREELNAALSVVQKAMPLRSTMDVLEGICIQAQKNSLLLRCSDMTLQIETVMSAQVEEEGQLVLGKLLFDIVRHLSSGMMEVTSISDSAAQVKSKKSRITIQALPGEDFPVMPKLRTIGEITLPRHVLKDLIRQTVFSTALDETKPILTGALLEIGKEGINMVALDGYRLALRHYPMPCADEAKIVLPAKSLNEISRVIGEEGDVKLEYGAGYASIDMEHTKICTQLLSGEYTKYRQILSNEHQTRVRIERSALLNSIERASIMAKEARNNLIKLSIDAETMVITSQSELGNTYDELPISCEGRDLEIAFNARYLLDVLKVLNDEEIYMDFNTNISPCMIRPVDSEAFLYLVLPVRVLGS